MLSKVLFLGFFEACIAKTSNLVKFFEPKGAVVLFGLVNSQKWVLSQLERCVVWIQRILPLLLILLRLSVRKWVMPLGYSRVNSSYQLASRSETRSEQYQCPYGPTKAAQTSSKCYYKTKFN